MWYTNIINKPKSMYCYESIFVYTTYIANECLNIFHYKYMLCVIWTAPDSDTVAADELFCLHCVLSVLYKQIKEKMNRSHSTWSPNLFII